MKNLQANQYKLLVEDIQFCIGRELTQDELSTVEWLSGSEKTSVSTIMGIIKAAKEHGKKVK